MIPAITSSTATTHRMAATGSALLLEALLGLLGVGLGALGVRPRLVLGHLALGLGFVLLGAPLVAHVLVAGHAAGGLLGLAFQVFSDARQPGLTAALLMGLVTQGGISLSRARSS